MKIIKDTRGSAPIWAAIIAFVLCMLAVVAYTGATLYSTYQTAQTELERAANVSVDDSLINANVRDLLLDIPATAVSQKLNENLAQAGYVQDSCGDWERSENGRIYYSIKNLQATVSGELLEISATVSMPRPWEVGAISTVDIPIHVESKVLYIN